MKQFMNSLGSLDKVSRLLWGAALLALPVTSFRYFPFMGEGTYVRPLAFYPLLLLMPVLLIRLLRGETRLPWARPLTPLLGFTLVALAATALGALLAPLVLRGQDFAGRAIRAWATLAIGLLFLAAAIWMNRSQDDLRFTVRWLLAGLALDVLWSALQAATFYLHLLPKPLLTGWQRAFSMRELVRTNRVSGLAYEPAWLAGQIGTLYLPWLFASLLTGIRVTRFKWLEPLLLVLAVLLLLATFSRGGLLAAGFAAGLTMLLAGRRHLRLARDWFAAGFRSGGGWAWRVGAILLVIGAVAGGLLFLAQKGYITRLWSTRADNLQDFIVQNSAGARAAYLMASLGAVRENPWTGVGLGASGFYMYPNLPDWALTTVPEIARQLSPDNALYPNPKNLYMRLLAETGLSGAGLFLAYLLSVLGEIAVLLRLKQPLWQYAGIAGLFSWLALLFHNLTQDSFAMPNLWLNFGILLGITAFAIQSGKSFEGKA
jgi:O-antigen ligase